MPGQEVGYSLGLLAAIGMLSLAGIALALRILPREVSADRLSAVATRVVAAGLLLAVTAWLLFLLALKFHFPHLELDIPWPLPITLMSKRDKEAPSLAKVRALLSQAWTASP